MTFTPVLVAGHSLVIFTDTVPWAVVLVVVVPVTDT
jgi:hypothetical protein